MRPRRIPVWFALLVFGATSALWINPAIQNPDWVLFWRSAAFSDLLVSHWPNAVFINTSVRLWGQIPMWNPTILSGYPFLADPLSGLWYPPLWLAAAFPRAITFNILIWLHLCWAALGAWRLAQDEGMSEYAALLSGLIFSGAPKFAAHIGLGHITLVSAVSWTPWLLISVRWALNSASLARSGAGRAFAVNGLTLAIIFLADPRWLVPSLVLLLLYALYILGTFKFRLRDSAVLAFRWAAVTGVFSLCGSAGLASALWAYTSRSTRTLIDPSRVDPFAVRWGEFTDLIVFNPIQPENFIYLGLGAVFLALVGLLFNRRRVSIWFGVALLGILLSIGGNLPLVGELLQTLPGVSLLRVPARWMFFVYLSSAMLAGGGFDALIEAPLRDRIYDRSMLLLAGLGLLTYILSTRLGSDPDRILLMLIPAAVFLPLVFVRRFGLLHPRTFLIAAIGLLAIEFGLVSFLVMEARPAPAITLSEELIPGEYTLSHGEGRVFSPSYSVDQLTAASAGIELADGVHPLQLRDYWAYMAEATGYGAGRYSVTLPPFPSGDPMQPWPISLDLEALRLINVTHVISAYPVEGEGLELLSTAQERFVYKLPDPLPRSWIEDDQAAATTWIPAEITYWSPNRIELVASGPGRLVLSEIGYPDWTARVDGEPVPVESAHGILRGLKLDEGDHRVAFAYRPVTQLAGIAVSLLTLVGAFVLEIRR